MFIIAVCTKFKACTLNLGAIVIWPEDLEARVGQTLFLPCVATVSETASVTWRRGNHLASQARVHTTVMSERNGTVLLKSVLEICLTAVDTGGEYSCQVMAGQELLDEASFHINVLPPQSECKKCNGSWRTLT